MGSLHRQLTQHRNTKTADWRQAKPAVKGSNVMPENTPSFVQIRKWIMEAAPDYGVRITGNRAKALAGRYLTELDPEMDDGRTDYADPTGDEAVRRWMGAHFATLERNNQ